MSNESYQLQALRQRLADEQDILKDTNLDQNFFAVRRRIREVERQIEELI